VLSFDGVIELGSTVGLDFGLDLGIVLTMNRAVASPATTAVQANGLTLLQS
jgi:hypothetical protein